MENLYTWNSKSNSFDGYEPQYEEHTDENGNVERVEIPCDKTLYTQAQVDAIFAGRGANQVIKDVNGVPAYVNLYTDAELTVQANKKRIAELKSLLQATDYQAIKYAEGEMPYEEYEPVRDLRKGWREEINDIEALLSI